MELSVISNSTEWTRYLLEGMVQNLDSGLMDWTVDWTMDRNMDRKFALCNTHVPQNSVYCNEMRGSS